MDKEFVTYEVALALKELEYYENTIKVYSIKWKKLMEEEYAVRFDIDYAKAPLKQQVFRWFREKYEFSSWIYNTNSDRYFYTILKNGRFVKDNEARTTYEEAESACIDKLIELVKKK